MNSTDPARARLAGLSIVTVLIVYGSLYPFHFVAPTSYRDALMLAATGQIFSSRGDVLGNIALFLPLGVIAALGTASRHRTLVWLGATVLAFILALGCQVAQIYVPERDARLGDVVWNMLGMVAGLLLGQAATRVYSRQFTRTRAEGVLALVVVALWMAAELAPFVPALDMQLIRDHLRMLLQPVISWPDLLLHASGPLAAAVFLDRALDSRVQVRTALIGLTCALLLGRTITLSTGLDASFAVGLLLGYWGAELVLSLRETRRHGVVLGVLIAAITARGLAPLEFSALSSDWHWIPFAGWLQGSMVTNVQALTASLYLYATALALVRASAGHVLGSALVLAMWVLLLEIAQRWIIGRTADASEPLLVLAVGIAIRSLHVSRSKLLQAQPGVAPSPSLKAAPAPSSRPSWQNSAIEASVVACVITAAIAIVLRLPNVPYNVLELFLGNGSLPFVLIFALAVLWLGAGSAWLARQMAASRHLVAAWPQWTFVVTTVSLILLSASVTQESIADIAGSTNLFYYVTEKDLWGTWARALFTWIGSADVIAFVERPVRFAALCGPLNIVLALAWLAHRRGGVQPGWKRIGILALAALPALWLCKAIAFDWSSTDNLNELIARDGNWALGGGGYLYALLALVCANAALLASLPRTSLTLLARACLLTLLALPAGWLLLNLGLEANVEKYSQTFSGVQFLLGPDRAHKLSEWVLFGRWGMVQLVGTLLLTEGLRVMRWLPPGERFDRYTRHDAANELTAVRSRRTPQS